MRLSILTLSIAAALATAGCARDTAPTAAEPGTPAAAETAHQAAPAVTDPHSYAEPGKVRTTDLALDLAVDFAKKTIAGTATYTLEWLDQNATQLVLDTRDLTIQKVEGQAADGVRWG